MAQVENLALLGAKIEAVPGVAEAIGAAQCNLLVEEPKFTPEQISNEQPVALPTHGTVQDVPGGMNYTVTFKVGLKGSGTPGTAPAIGTLFRCCEMTETLAAGLWAKYTPATTPIATQVTCTLELFNDGRYYIAKGCQGTVKFTGKGNEIHYAEFEFKGIYEDDGDTAIPSSPSLENTVPLVLLNADLDLLEYHTSTQEGAIDGTAEALRDGVASNVELAAIIDGTNVTTIKELRRVRLMLKKNGTPAGHTNGLQVHVEGDAAGVPDGVTLGSASRYVDPVAINTTAEYIDFIFDTPPLLAAGTLYHLILSADYTESAVNNVEWQTHVVAATTSDYYDAAWAPLTNSNDFIVQLLVADQAALKFDGIDVDVANAVQHRQDVNATEGWDQAVITGRNPVGTLEPEEEFAADRDFMDYWRQATRLMTAYTLGTVAGSIIDIHLPYTRVMKTDMGERDEIKTSPLDVKFNTGLPGVVTGNDEFEIKFS